MTMIEPEVNGAGVDLEDDNSLDRVLDELGGDINRVYLYGLENTKQKYIGAYDAGEFSLEMVKRNFGGGRYVVRFLNSDNRFMKGSSVFYIDERFKAAPEPAAAPPPAAGPTPVVESVLARLLDRMDALERRASAPPAAPASDPLELAIKLSTMVQGSVRDALESAKDSRPRGPSPNALLNAFTEGMKIAQETGGDATAAVIQQYAPRVLDIMDRILEARPEAGGKKPVRALKPAKQSPFAEAASVMPRLVALSRSGKDPELWADVALESFPGPCSKLVGVFDQLGEDAAFAEFFATFPAAAEGTSEAWFRAFITSIRRAGDDDGEEEEEGDVAAE